MKLVSSTCSEQSGRKTRSYTNKNKDFFEKLIKNDEKDSVLFPVVMNCLESIFDRK
jgi:hypothetical protein